MFHKSFECTNSNQRPFLNNENKTFFINIAIYGFISVFTIICVLTSIYK